MDKPTKDKIKTMNPGEFSQYAAKFLTKCASCGRHGQPVTESIEGKGYSYCDDVEECKRHQ